MSTAKEIRNKIFSQAAGGAEGAAAPTTDQGLTIDIPKPISAPAAPVPLPKTNKPKVEEEVESEPQGDTRSYRQKVLDALGTSYTSVENYRLEQDGRKERHWKRWGPYLAERQWATVREDYSGNGDAWANFPHSAARSRAYRWGEDGIGGVSDNHQRLCFALALWNGEDPFLKERLFGVTGPEGNHGEDCKELYYYLDSTPTHSYMKFLYKYPQRRFPYEELVRESVSRGRDVPEFEIHHTEAFEDDRYWDVFIEYAKDADDPEAMSIRITAYNRGPEPADLHIIPQLWFPNTWSWTHNPPPRPQLKLIAPGTVQVTNEKLSTPPYMYCIPSPPPVGPIAEGEDVVEVEGDGVTPNMLFTENDTNYERLYGGKNSSPYVKDAFHDHIKRETEILAEKGKTEEAIRKSPVTPTVRAPPRPWDEQRGDRPFVNPKNEGTKCGAQYVFKAVPPRGGCAVVRLKLTPHTPNKDPSIWDEELFDDTIDERRQDADEFYARLSTGPEQFYQFIHKEWMEGDPAQPPPPPERKWVRNREWRHLHIADVLSMPDKWEYPFFAAWDTAFHCIPLAMVDPAFAKKQLDLLTREWYMKPDGALPAYEWNFSDVNPPVHAWATFRVFKIERKLTGNEDVPFLERVFQKLLLNFTWWVNRKDAGGHNVFEGGFLGLDNIGAFNRSEPLPTGGVLRQADGTAWMAFYCLNMLNMALELAKHNSVYEDIASKFFEHFIFIADAMTYRQGDNELSLWNEEEGFYFDAIQWGESHSQQMPIRSLVGLIPLYATLVLEPSVINRFPGFKKRMEWFIDNRPEISARNMANMKGVSVGSWRSRTRTVSVRILEKMLDESEFFSDYGIRSMSLYHKDHPWSINVKGQDFGVEYWPGDSRSGMFGGNSNWRGPIWLAVNFLLVESLQRFHQYYGNDLQVECPTGSGDYMDLAKVADEIQHRLIHIFGRDMEGRRAQRRRRKLDRDPHFRDYVLFHEFFHGDDGRGLGASHQTGWTGLVAFSIMQSGLSCRLPRTPKTPRSVARHYFDEHIDTVSEAGDAPFSAYSAIDRNTFGDVSPDAL
ncbi:Glycosyl hydrolase family 63 C-terminal domain [Rhizoctonia solani]|uniref:Glycosyl hydrolase family 63 C-terminal domain n=1 Tax=Rhizoctonia solani TaxID=456999 RepID=A0A8H7I864_9AGAM|nr:Glycosyl hydrolase family 63 C-terminal domain [Rhizoctonia solani]